MKNKVIIGKSVLMPTGGGNISGSSLLTGELFYNINDKEYKSVKPKESFESKLSKICLLITCGNRYAVGIKYTSGSPDGPELLLKTTSVKLIKKLSVKLGLIVINNKKLASNIFKNTEEYSVIPVQFWFDIAVIFADLIKEKNKWFKKKINISQKK